MEQVLSYLVHKAATLEKLSMGPESVADITRFVLTLLPSEPYAIEPQHIPDTLTPVPANEVWFVDGEGHRHVLGPQTRRMDSPTMRWL